MSEKKAEGAKGTPQRGNTQLLQAEEFDDDEKVWDSILKGNRVILDWTDGQPRAKVFVAYTTGQEEEYVIPTDHINDIKKLLRFDGYDLRRGSFNTGGPSYQVFYKLYTKPQGDEL